MAALFLDDNLCNFVTGCWLLTLTAVLLVAKDYNSRLELDLPVVRRIESTKTVYLTIKVTQLESALILL